jgi:choloylglycine hydrolase
MKLSARIFASALLSVGTTFALLFAQAAQACTGIRLAAADGAVIHARTLEFAVDLQSDVILVPRGYSRTGTTPDSKPGKKWTARYASLGANGVGLPLIFDGLNEKGLAIGQFYFPGAAGYQAYASSNARKTIAPWELGSYLLDNFATVDEIKKNVLDIIVADVVFAAWKFVPPVHYVATDATGKTIVIEYVGGKLDIHDDPLGVITNSPAFDWHMANLRNYVNFSLTNHPPVQLDGVTLEPFGQGSGMLGMPGDFTPPSRFVRAVAFSQSALPSATGGEAVLQAFHILNNFDIPKGAARDPQKDAHGNVVADYTLWTSAIDLRAKQFYFRTYENSQIRMIDLAKQKLDGEEIVKWSMGGGEVIKDLGTP